MLRLHRTRYGFIILGLVFLVFYASRSDHRTAWLAIGLAFLVLGIVRLRRGTAFRD